MKMKNIISDILSVLLTTLVYILGGFDVALKSLIIIVVIDYLTGVGSAYYNKKVSSKKGLKGIIKKFCYFLIVALAVVIDNLMGQSGVIRTLVIYFFVANDGISIIENMAEMDVKLPKKLIESLEDMKHKSE